MSRCVKYPTDNASYRKYFKENMDLTDAFASNHREYSLRCELLLVKSNYLLRELELSNNNKNPKLTNDLRNIKTTISGHEEIVGAFLAQNKELGERLDAQAKELRLLMKLEDETPNVRVVRTSKGFLPDERYEKILSVSNKVRLDMAALFGKAWDLKKELETLHEKLEALAKSSKDDNTSSASAAPCHSSMWGNIIARPIPRSHQATAVATPKK